MRISQLAVRQLGGDLRLPILLTVVLALSAAAWGQEPAADTSDTAPIAVGDSAPSDDEIRQRLENLLSEIDGFDGVSLRVSQGVVTLTGDVIDNAARDELADLVGRIEGVIRIDNEVQVSGSLEERLAPAADRIVERAGNILANAPIFLVALAAFLIVALGGWLLTTRLPIWTWLAPNAFIADVYRAIARIIFIVLGAVLALDILNAIALIGAVLGAAGVAGLAVGFAVRDTVENFIASILLSLRQPFRPNDFVDIQGDMGTVARLTSRATILISPQGNHIRIPNATVYKGRIVNYSRDPQRRFEFDLGVDAESDLNRALATAVEAMNGLNFILRDPEVGAWIKEVGDSNVVLTFVAWVDQRSVDYLKARGEAIRTAKTALEGAGFGLPEPIYRLRIDDGGTKRLNDLPREDTTGSLTVSQPSGLPDAADPSRQDHATEDAALRERATEGDENNLLDASRASE